MLADMNTSHTDDQSAAARAMLDSLADDRKRLADQAVAPARWYYPALAVTAAAMVALPALEDAATSSMLLALVALAFAGIALAHRRQTGVAVNYGTTPKSLAVAIGIVVAIAGLLVGSFVLARLELHPWIIATTAGAFLVMLAGSYAADRLHRAEISRGR